MPLSMPANWRESAAVSKRVQPVARLYYGPAGSTDYIAVASDAIGLGADEYAPLLQALPAVDYGVDVFTHQIQSGSLRLSLINNGLSDLLEDAGLGSGSDTGFENRRCELRLWAKGITTWSGCLVYFTGIMRRVEHHYDRVLIDLHSQDQLTYLQLPRTEITLANYPDAPQSSIGKFLPICIGSIDYAPGYVTANIADVWTTTYPTIRFDDAGYATDGLKAFNTISSVPFPQGPLFTWTGTRFIPARTDSDKRFDHGSAQLADCRINFTSSWINVLAEVYASAAAATWDGSNSARVTNGSISQASLKSANAPWTKTVTLRTADQGNLPAQKIWEVYAFCRLDGTTQADSTATLKLFDNTGNSVTVLSLPASTTDSFNNMTDPPPDGYTSKQLGSYPMTGEQQFYYQFDTVKTGAGSFSVSMSPYELGLVLLANENDHSRWPWYARIDGRMDDSSGTYTGSNGALIEVPTDAIYHIAANDLAITDLSADSFTASRTALTGWKHAYSQNSRLSASDLFSQLGRQSKSFALFNADMNFTVLTISDTYSSADRVIDFETVSAPRFTRTDMDQIATKVIVKYALNYADGQYASQVTGEDTAQQERYNLTAGQSTLEIEAGAVRDATTAGKLRDYLLRQWKQPHNLFEGVLPLDHLDLEVGDVIEFTNVSESVRGEDITQNNTRNGQTIYKYWWITRVRRSNTSMRINAMQLHDLS